MRGSAASWRHIIGMTSTQHIQGGTGSGRSCVDRKEAGLSGVECGGPGRWVARTECCETEVGQLITNRQQHNWVFEAGERLVVTFPGQATNK